MPERSVRFVVADGQGHRAGSWKCLTYTGKGNHEVYLACRELGVLKVSLHQSGDWRIAWVNGVLEQHLEDPSVIPSRIFMQWQRPAEIGPGVTHALRIIVPLGAVCVPITEPFPAKTVVIPAPPPHKAVEIMIFYTSPTAVVTDWPGKRAMATELVGTLDLDNGERVWIVHRLDDLPKFPAQHGKPTWFKGAAEMDWEDPRLRCLAYGRDDRGVPFIYESRVERVTHADETTRTDR
jgi:hypothetical protein